MSDMSGAELAQLVQKIKLASANIRTADDETRQQSRAIEQSVNDLYKKIGRPGAEWTGADGIAERKSAIGLYQIHKNLVAFLPEPPRRAADLGRRRGACGRTWTRCGN